MRCYVSISCSGNAVAQADAIALRPTAIDESPPVAFPACSKFFGSECRWTLTISPIGSTANLWPSFPSGLRQSAEMGRTRLCLLRRCSLHSVITACRRPSGPSQSQRSKHSWKGLLRAVQETAGSTCSRSANALQHTSSISCCDLRFWIGDSEQGFRAVGRERHAVSGWRSP